MTAKSIQSRNEAEPGGVQLPPSLQTRRQEEAECVNAQARIRQTPGRSGRSYEIETSESPQALVETDEAVLSGDREGGEIAVSRSPPACLSATLR